MNNNLKTLNVNLRGLRETGTSIGFPMFFLYNLRHEHDVGH